MPEGPEVKTVARTLNENLRGKSLGKFWHSAFRLRKEVDYARLKKLEKSVISNVKCYGKVLFICSENKPIIFAQLGMTGQLKVEATKAPVASHTHIRWQLDNSHELRYVDPRRFGLFSACNEDEQHKILKKLGPDAFALNLEDLSKLIERLSKSSRSIKEVLLDQSIIAGIGNIYASEALFLARIDPKKRALDISPKNYDLLIKAVTHVMELAYKNCGTTFSNYVDGSGKKGNNLEFLQVFQRNNQHCFVCKNIIYKITQQGRSTFYCKKCQK